MKSVLAIAVGILLTGCARAPEDPLCAVVANPSSYVGKSVTLSGTARMYKQRVGLYSQACPSQALLLAMGPEDTFKSAHHVSTPNIVFLNQVVRLLGTGASVTVTGRVTPAPGQPDPFALTIESAALK
ncbi:hypothetical protein [Lysobacter sp. TY2-98]|uniref:hypothetical protein n=1 Tax=Lysobacter sp. TY2-98 TaxID=2290922 RepID=UPI0013B3F933|nr:hypothetical protein [Lysobacter sp. TY2-98]